MFHWKNKLIVLYHRKSQSENDNKENKIVIYLKKSRGIINYCQSIVFTPSKFFVLQTLSFYIRFGKITILEVSYETVESFGMHSHCCLRIGRHAGHRPRRRGGGRFGFYAGLDTKLPGFITGGGEDMGVSQYRVGAMIEPIPKILIKPDVIFVFEEENEDDTYNDNSYLVKRDTTYGGGISIYYKVLPADRVSIYMGPRIDFLQITEEDETTWPSVHKDDEYKTTTFSFTACIAGQYEITEHFGLFAETGIGYRSTTKDRKSYDDVGDLDQNDLRKNSKIYTYGGQIGVAFYF